MVALGWMYRWGNKQVPQDLRKSYEICERASRTDKTGEALRCVASFHMDGLVVKQDTKRAIAMLVKSANMGDSLSMLSYGDMLWDGHDVKQDRPGAIRWWCKGARDGATEGNERLAENLGFDAKSASDWTCEEMAEFFATPEIVKAAKNPRWYVGRAWERLKARFQ